MEPLPYPLQQIGAPFVPRVQPAIDTNPRKFIYTGAHDRIIKDALSRYHLLRAKDITRLLYPTEKQGMFTTVKQRLADLTRNKYVTAVSLPTAEGGRPLVYALGLRGRKLLRDEGIDVYWYKEQAELETRSPGWFYHPLELNSFLISGATLERTVPTLTLKEWEHDFSIAANPPLAVKKDGKKAQVNPDGLLHFILTASEKPQHLRLLIELDRGSESDAKLSKKFYDYMVCFDNEALQNRFGGRRFLILFVTTAGAAQVEKMRNLAREAIKAYDEKNTSFYNNLFKFAAIPPLKEQPIESKTLFCSPLWLNAYGKPTDTTALIDLEQ